MANKEITELLADLAAEGYTVARSGGGHWRVTRPDLPAARSVFVPSTPSDRRSMKNTLADLRRNLGYERGRQMEKRRYPRPGVVHRAFMAAGPRGLTVPQMVEGLPARYRTGRDHRDLVTWAAGVIRQHSDLYLDAGKERREGSAYKSTVWRWVGSQAEPPAPAVAETVAAEPAKPTSEGHAQDLRTIVEMVMSLPLAVLDQEDTREQLKRLAPVVDAARNY